MTAFTLTLLFLPLLAVADLTGPFLGPGRAYHDPVLSKVRDMDSYDEKNIKQNSGADAEICTLTLMSEYLDFLDHGQRSNTKDYSHCRSYLKADEDTDITDYNSIFSSDFITSVGYFLGENWIEGSRHCTIYGCEIFEGGQLTEGVRFLNFLTSGVLAKYGFNLDMLFGNSKAKERLLKAKENLKHVYALTKIVRSSAKVWEKANVFANYFSAAVDVGQEWVIPAIVLSPSGGHAILISLIKTSSDKVDLAVYNTGDGLNYHPMLQGRKHRRYSFKLQFRGLDLKNDIVDSCFFDFLVTCTTGAKKGSEYNTKFFYNQVLLLFRDKLVEELPSDVDDYSLPQRAGNCYQKVIFAYIKDRLGKDDYKIFERAVTTSLLGYLYDIKFYERGEIQKEIVLRGLKNEARKFLRLNLKKIISKEELGQKNEELKEKIEVIKKKVFAVPNFTKVLTQRSLSQILYLSSEKNYIDEEDTEYVADLEKLLKFETSDDLLNNAAEMKEILIRRDEWTCLYYGFAFISALPQPRVDGRDIYRQIQKYKLDEFEENIVHIANKVEGKDAEAMGVVVMAKMVAVFWRLLILRGSKLTESVLDLRVFELPLKSGQVYFYTPEMLEEYEKSVKYLKDSTNQGTTLPHLFDDFIDRKGTSLNFMSETSAEYSFLKSISVPDEVESAIHLFESTCLDDMKSEVGKVLRHDKLRIAYMYISGYPRVPLEFSYIRIGMFKIHEFSTAPYDSRKYRKIHFQAHKNLEVERLFNFFFYNAGTISLDKSEINISELEVNSERENSAIVKRNPLASTLLLDMDLLKAEPPRNRIYFALYCLANYTEEIFRSEAYTKVLELTFFKGSMLKQTLDQNALVATSQLQAILDTCYQKLKSLALVTGIYEPLQSFCNLEILLQRWVKKKINRGDFSIVECPATLLNEQKKYGKCIKPVYVSEFQSLLMISEYPQYLKQMILDDEPIRSGIEIRGGDLNTCKLEFPFLRFNDGDRHYVYDYWKDKFVAASKREIRLNDAGLFSNIAQEERDRALEELKSSGDTFLNGSRYGLSKCYKLWWEQVKDVGKFILGKFYDLKADCQFSETDQPIVQNFSVFYESKKANDGTTTDDATFVFDYKLSAPELLRGKTYLTIEKISNKFTVIESDKKWKLLKRTDIPDPILNFCQWKHILLLKDVNSVSDGENEKILILNAFTLELIPISITRIDQNHFVGDRSIITDSAISVKYRGCLILKNEDGVFSALVPLVNDFEGLFNTPFELFDIKDETINPVERKQKLKFALYLISYQYYEDALEILYDVNLTSAFTELEEAFLKKIIFFNADKVVDDRPEVASISFYAMYLYYISGGLSKSSQIEPLPEHYQTFFPKMFSTGDFATVISNYYTKLGRMPSKFLLTSLVKRDTENYAISNFYEDQLLRLLSTEYMMFKLSKGERRMESLGKDALQREYINKVYVHLFEAPWSVPKGDPLQYYRRSDRLTDPSDDLLLTMLQMLGFCLREKKFKTEIEKKSALNYLKTLFMSQKIDESVDYQRSVKFHGLFLTLKPGEADNFSRLENKEVYELVMENIDPTKFEHKTIKGSPVIIDDSALMLPKVQINEMTSQILNGIENSNGIRLWEDFSKIVDLKIIIENFKNRNVLLPISSDLDLKFTNLKPALLENQIITRPLSPIDIENEKAAMAKKLSEPMAKVEFEKIYSDLILDIGDKLKKGKEWLKDYADKAMNEFEKAVSIPAKHFKELYDAAILSDLLKTVQMKDLLGAFMRRDPVLYGRMLAHLDFDSAVNSFTFEHHITTLKESVIAKIHHLIYIYRYTTILARRMDRAILALNTRNLPALLEELEEETADPAIDNVVLGMEYYLNFRIREKNVENISRMVRVGARNDYNQTVLQSIMGSGKTVTISPALNFLKSNDQCLSVFCPPSTHFETNVDKLTSYAKNMFQQQSLIIHFNRSKESTSTENLVRIYDELKEAISAKKITFIKFEDLQAMNNQLITFLNFKDDVENFEKDSEKTQDNVEKEEYEQLKKAVLLSKILQIFKESANMTFDEVDFTFKTNKMFNFPASTSGILDLEMENMMKSIFASINDLHGELRKYHIDPRTGATQNISLTTEIISTRENVCKLIATKWIEKMAKDTNFTISHPQFKENMKIASKETTELLVNFIVNEPLGLIASIKSLITDENQARLWVTAQHIIQSIIPDTWSTICSCNYGFSKNADKPFNDPDYCGVAKPYSFAGEPSESSSWSNKYETAFKTFQMYYENGLRESQITEYFKLLMQIALDEYRNNDVSLKNTRAYKRFESYGFKNGLQQVLLFPGKSKLQDPLNPGFIKKLSADLRGPSDPRLVEFISDFVLDVPMKKETFYSSQIVNTAQFMATRFKNSQGFSGTAQRDYQYWVGTDFIPDEGASIAVHASIISQKNIVYEIKSEADAWKVVTKNKPEFNIYSENGEVEVDHGDSIRALIDLGAFLRTTKNELVASNIIKNTEGHINCVIYYNEDNKLSCFKRNENDNSISGPHKLVSESSVAIAKETKVPIERTFVYYDQKHTLGSDFKMVDGTVAYVTVGPTTTRTDLEQAVMRMRGLLQGKQMLRFVLTPDVSRIIAAKMDKKEKEGQVNLQSIVEHSISNEAELFKSDDISGKINRQNMQLVFQKIKAQYMDLAFTKIVSLSADGEADEAKTRFNTVKDWFIESTDEFAVLENSKFLETKKVLSDFSDSFRDRLLNNDIWSEEYDQARSINLKCIQIISIFVERNLIEPKTSSAELGTSISCQVQTETQTQTQTLTEMNIEVRNYISKANEEFSFIKCAETLPAGNQIRYLMKEMAISPFDDNIRISRNFDEVTSSSQVNSFFKTPTYFLKTGTCIVAITHFEASEYVKQYKNELVFTMARDIPVALGDKTVSLSEDELMNLLIFSGSFSVAMKKKYRNSLMKWIERRIAFGQDLFENLQYYDRKIGKQSSMKKFLNLVKEATKKESTENLDFNEWTNNQSDFLKKNPLFFVHALVRQNFDLPKIVSGYLPAKTILAATESIPRNAIKNLFNSKRFANIQSEAIYNDIEHASHTEKDDSFKKNAGISSLPNDSGAGYRHDSGTGYRHDSGAGYPRDSGTEYPRDSGAGYRDDSGAEYPHDNEFGYPSNTYKSSKRNTESDDETGGATKTPSKNTEKADPDVDQAKQIDVLMITSMVIAAVLFIASASLAVYKTLRRA